MITSTYSIAFDFQVDNSKLIVPLTAEVELHHSETYYVVKNITSRATGNRAILPDFTIKNKHGRWGHLDSGQESHLSIEVGKSIEAIQSRQLNDNV